MRNGPQSKAHPYATPILHLADQALLNSTKIGPEVEEGLREKPLLLVVAAPSSWRLEAGSGTDG
jgi:hypothetical protein